MILENTIINGFTVEQMGNITITFHPMEPSLLLVIEPIPKEEWENENPNDLPFDPLSALSFFLVPPDPQYLRISCLFVTCAQNHVTLFKITANKQVFFT